MVADCLFAVCFVQAPAGHDLHVSATGSGTALLQVMQLIITWEQ